MARAVLCAAGSAAFVAGAALCGRQHFVDLKCKMAQHFVDLEDCMAYHIVRACYGQGKQTSSTDDCTTCGRLMIAPPVGQRIPLPGSQPNIYPHLYLSDSSFPSWSKPGSGFGSSASPASNTAGSLGAGGGTIGSTSGGTIGSTGGTIGSAGVGAIGSVCAPFGPTIR